MKKETKERLDIKEQQTNIEKDSHDSKEKNSKKKGVLFSLLVVSVLLVCAVVFMYFSRVGYYKNHFLAQTYINGIDCKDLTVAEAAEQMISSYENSYKLTILGKDNQELLTLTASDVEMVFHVETSLQQLLDNQNPYGWFTPYFKKEPNNLQLVATVEYSEEILRNVLEQADLFDSSESIEPQNAYISEYLEEKKCYEIVPEEDGSILIEEVTIACIDEAIKTMEDTVNLEEKNCYEKPEITSDNKDLQEKLAVLNKMVGAQITYDWNGTEEIVDGELISTWIVFEGDSITLDEELVADYVAEKARKHDTYGKNRNFLTTLGVELSLPSGGYGWRTNRGEETAALIELILEGAVTGREPIYSYTGWAKGKNDIGNSYVEIDLTNQHLYLYQDGQIVLETDFVSGDMAKGNTTPPGVFGLTYKTRNAILRGGDYETPVSYWMPFHGNYGMHDATWRNEFGGDIYLTDGSHGCVNLPLDMAAEIYSYMSAGFPIVCYYY